MKAKSKQEILKYLKDLQKHLKKMPDDFSVSVGTAKVNKKRVKTSSSNTGGLFHISYGARQKKFIFSCPKNKGGKNYYAPATWKGFKEIISKREKVFGKRVLPQDRALWKELLKDKEDI